jgi:hypothetical protein
LGVCGGTEIDEQPHIISFNTRDGVDGEYTQRTVGPFATSLEYFYTVRQGDNRAVLAKHADEDDWATACWILKQALPAMITQNNIHGPFPLCHLDLHFNNILLDDNYNITGIIDWSEAQTVPLERYAISPEFVTFPGLTAEENEPIKAFCALFVKALKNRERIGPQDNISKQSPMLSDIVGTPMAELVYRCTYSYPWRALSDARLVLRLLYGKEATLETFKAFYRSATVSSQQTCIGA